MLDHAVEAVEMVHGLDAEDLTADRKLALAMVQLSEIIGEAANRVSTGLTAEHPEIPWTDIVDLRNRLIHGYDSIDLDLLWDIVALDLPPLIDQLRLLLRELNE